MRLAPRVGVRLPNENTSPVHELDDSTDRADAEDAQLPFEQSQAPAFFAHL
jgi:hypothetical protein